jgi:hypothetical protein
MNLKEQLQRAANPPRLKWIWLAFGIIQIWGAIERRSYAQGAFALFFIVFSVSVILAQRMSRSTTE